MNQQRQEDTNEQPNIPPSFTPSPNPTDRSASIPPSFTPSSSHHLSPTNTHHEHAANKLNTPHQTKPVSFTPSHRRIQPSQTTPQSAPHNNLSHNARPQSFSPRNLRRSTPHTENNQSTYSSRTSDNRTNAGSTHRAVINSQTIPAQVKQPSAATLLNQTIAQPAQVGSAITQTRHRKHRLLTILSIFFLIILVVLGGLSLYTWNWIDSRMQREPWLTTMGDTSETTWLILGSDQREGKEAKEITGFRTDTILLLTKPKHGSSSLISIPRDSLVTVNGESMKINAVAQRAGKAALTGVVEQITGHRIDHVAEIRFAGLTNLVNALGGIDLCYNRTVSDRFSGLTWTAGCHHANGTVALAFARMRYADPRSDFGRAERQRMVISAIMKKALARETLTNINRVQRVAETGLRSVMLDEHANPASLFSMSMAFKEATGPKGITGTPYWSDPDYQVPGVGSSVLLDTDRNRDLFNELANGTHAPGKVGTLAELTNTAS